MAHPEWHRVTLRNKFLHVEVLPELGGKIASIGLLPEGGIFLQEPLREYAARTPDMPFDQADGSGWDECLPSVGACTISTAGGQVQVPDHGDLWRQAWTVEEASDTKLRTQVNATSLPLTFTRTVTLQDSAIVVDYSVRNHGTEETPWGWSIHPLFAVQPEDRIHIPGYAHEVTAQASANGRLGPEGLMHQWPMTMNSLDGQPLDLSRIGMPTDGVGDKIVMPSPKEGSCALERIGLRTRMTMRWDAKQFPWLGLWLCYGGWPEDPKAKKGYAVAIEPCNLPVDSLAASLKEGGGAKLAAGATSEWTIRLEFEKAEER